VQSEPDASDRVRDLVDAESLWEAPEFLKKIERS
jgi:hypothetical protein